MAKKINTSVPDELKDNPFVIQLVEGITGLQADLSELNTQVSSLSGEIGGHKSVAQKFQAKADELAAQLTTRNAAFAELETLFANTKNITETLNTQVLEATAAKASMEGKIGLYQLVAKTPRYHGLLDVIDDLNLPADPAVATAVLDKLAGKLETVATQAGQASIADFRSGGLPKGNVGATPGDDGTPKNRTEAIAKANQLINSGAPYSKDEFSRYLNMAAEFEAQGLIN